MLCILEAFLGSAVAYVKLFGVLRISRNNEILIFINELGSAALGKIQGLLKDVLGSSRKANVILMGIINLVNRLIQIFLQNLLRVRLQEVDVDRNNIVGLADLRMSPLFRTEMVS